MPAVLPGAVNADYRAHTQVQLPLLLATAGPGRRVIWLSCPLGGERMTPRFAREQAGTGYLGSGRVLAWCGRGRVWSARQFPI